MNTEIKSYFASNLRALRKKHKETQKELGETIYVDSKEISKYEKGTRNPSPETIKYVSDHYGIPVELLLYKDLSGILDMKLPMDSKEHFFDMANNIFNMFSSEEAQKNTYFRDAYEILDSMSLEEPQPQLLKKCHKLFKKAWKEEHLYEALSNDLLVFYVEWSTINAERIVKNIRELTNPRKNSPPFQRILLRNYTDVPKEIKEQQKEYYCENHERIWKEIKLLRSNPEWTEFGDYYICLLYISDMIDNDLSREINNLIGYQMLASQYYLDNQYAVNFWESFYNIK